MTFAAKIVLHVLLGATVWRGSLGESFMSGGAPQLSVEEDWAAMQLAGYPPGNYVNYAKEVWLSSNTGSSPYANDGIQRGFFGQKEVTATAVEDSPWLRVDLGQVRVVVAAELWVPLNPCASLKQMLKKCPQGMPVSSSQPLEVILEGQNSEHLATHTITEQVPVFAWDRVHIAARYVKFHLPGPLRQLHATEVKVWVADPDMQLCTERSCSGGKCICVGEGCPRQLCRCDPSRLGTEDCMTDPKKDWRYMPLQTAGPSEMWKPALWQRLMGELHALQAPEKKCNGEVFNGLIGAGARGAGLASTLHFVTGQLSEAYFKGRPFVFGGHFNYAGTKHCKRKGMLGDFDCYFEAFSGGSCLEVKDQARKGFKGIKVNPKQPNRCAIGRLCNDVGHFKRVPEDEYGEQGLFWWRTAMAAHLLRVNQDTSRALALVELKRRIGFRHPIVGVHVRHGDACHTTLRKGRCKGLETYLPEIRLMARRYNTTRVYLATDDPAVVEDTKRFPEFQFVFPDFNRDVLNSKQQIEYRKSLWDGSNDDGHSIMLSSLVDLLLLAESDFLILHLLSNMSRLALELSAAYHLRVPPYISMDGPWCHHWKMCMG
mmetsp:Transcript_35000/g.99196  ORF Transcript_35000/g.99196 Transcript_35000/m.99196 type:complete len:599 (-) Transcript_35000:199-1995(-)